MYTNIVVYYNNAHCLHLICAWCVLCTYYTAFSDWTISSPFSSLDAHYRQSPHVLYSNNRNRFLYRTNSWHSFLLFTCRRCRDHRLCLSSTILYFWGSVWCARASERLWSLKYYYWFYIYNINRDINNIGTSSLQHRQ